MNENETKDLRVYLKAGAFLKRAIRAAWPYTIPVLTGYTFLGIAFGVLMRTEGHLVWQATFMSIVTYAGALQFAAIPLLRASLDPLSTLVMALMLSVRHIFYGISMLGRYRGTGRAKPFLIFALTDETFSLVSTIETSPEVDRKSFYLAISFLNYLYWILGTSLGAIFGSFIGFDTTGIDFVLTALFLVLLVEHCRTIEGLRSGLLGLFATALVLIIAGPTNLVLIAMGAITIALLVGKPWLKGARG